MQDRRSIMTAGLAGFGATALPQALPGGVPGAPPPIRNTIGHAPFRAPAPRFNHGLAERARFVRRA